MARPDQEFARVYEEHVWTVYGFIGYRVSSREQAEDLTQATFERALKAWSRYDSAKSSPATWLLAIARNLVIDHYRRDEGGRQAPLEDEQAETAGVQPGPDESGLGIDAELEAALAALSDRDREVIALRYGGDLNGPEIADLTGLTLANVQQILSRALRRLKSELAPGGSERIAGSG